MDETTQLRETVERLRVDLRVLGRAFDGTTKQLNALRETVRRAAHLNPLSRTLRDAVRGFPSR